MDYQDPDFSAAMSSPATVGQPQDDEELIDFSALMVPKKRGRPRKLEPAPAGPSPSSKHTHIYNGENIDISDIGVIDKDIKYLNDIDLKNKLTSQELTFLEIFFNSPRGKGQGRVTIEKAMIAAGYTDYGKNWRYILAKKIMGKYASATGDNQKLFQDLGYGRLKIAQGIIDHAENSPPTVSLNALALAAKINDMVREKGDLGPSINININTGPSPGAPEAPGVPPRGVQVVIPGQTEEVPPPRRPLQITR